MRSLFAQLTGGNYFLFNWVLLLLAGLLVNQRFAHIVLVFCTISAVVFEARQQGFSLPSYAARIGKQLMHPVLFALACVPVLLLVSNIWSPFENATWFRPLSLLGVLAAFCICAVSAQGRFQNLPGIPLLLAVCIYVAIQVPRSWGPSWSDGLGIHPDFYNRQFFSAVIIVLCLSFVTIVRGKSASWVPAALALVSLPCAIMTDSQTAAIALLLGWLFFGFFTICGPRVMTLTLWVTCLVPVAMPALIFVANSALRRAMASNDALNVYMSGDIRIDIWETAINLISLRPFLGWGHGSFTKASPFAEQGYVYSQVTDIYYTHPHNAFLQVFTETGLLGIAVLTFLMAVLVRTILYMPPAMRKVSATLYLTIIGSISVSHGAWQSWWAATLVLVALLCLSATHLDERDGYQKTTEPQW